MAISTTTLPKTVKDLTGLTIKKFTVINFSHTSNKSSYWHVVCICGNKKTLKQQTLFCKSVVGCGCSKHQKKDYTGQKFGMLTALKFTKRLRDKSYWLFKCDCGTELENYLSNIISSRKRNVLSNCGCMKLPKGEAAFRALYREYEYGAVNRGHEFTLTSDTFRGLVTQNCHYCGVEPKQVLEKSTGSFTYNGIDRQDNFKGYTKDNCVPCCRFCNVSKGQLTAKEFLVHIQKIYAYNLGKS